MLSERRRVVYRSCNENQDLEANSLRRGGTSPYSLPHLLNTRSRFPDPICRTFPINGSGEGPGGSGGRRDRRMSSQVMLTQTAPATNNGVGRSNEASFMSAGKWPYHHGIRGGVYMRLLRCDQQSLSTIPYECTLINIPRRSRTRLIG